MTTRAEYFERRFIKLFGIAPTTMSEAEVARAVTEHERESETKNLIDDIGALLARSTDAAMG